MPRYRNGREALAAIMGGPLSPADYAAAALAMAQANMRTYERMQQGTTATPAQCTRDAEIYTALARAAIDLARLENDQ